MQSDHQSETAAVASAQSTLLKDLMIPLSIVIAGGLIGAGLYFGGGQAGTQAINAPTDDTAAVADATSKVDPVTAEDHIKGDPEAPIVIVEFSDFDCPFCSRFHDVMDKIVAEQDDVAWVYRQFPLQQLHPQAPAVAAASECVAELGGNDAFWTFTDAYFAARGGGDNTAHAELIPQLVLQAGVEQAAFTECFESGRTQAAVQADIDDAVETGGRGTPWSIIIGPTGKTYPVNGALPQAAVEQLIAAARADA